MYQLFFYSTYSYNKGYLCRLNFIRMEVKHKLSINQWALEDRPREKMMEKGAAALSDAELLAILIGSGNTDESAVELMQSGK